MQRVLGVGDVKVAMKAMKVRWLRMFNQVKRQPQTNLGQPDNQDQIHLSFMGEPILPSCKRRTNLLVDLFSHGMTLNLC